MKQAKIVLKDEVNCRIEGLSLLDRQHFSRKFAKMVPYAYHTPSYKLGRWDGKIYFFSQAGSTYNNILDEIVPEIIERGYSVDIDDKRIKYDFSKLTPIQEDTFQHIKWPKGHPHEGESVILRDYQVNAVNQFLKNPQCIQELSTSSGKTIITASLSKIVEPYGRTLVIVPNKSLVEQTYQDYENIGLDVGVYYGDKKELDKTHTICTWQSLESIERQKREGKRSDGLTEFAEGVFALIVDECFHEETPIMTPSGYIPIKDIKENDIIINYCEKTNKFKEDIVVKKHVNLKKTENVKMLELEFDNGKKIKVTENHKFLTDVGWVMAKNLTEDMEIINF